MNIKTKYDVGKSAFTMINNKVAEVRIRRAIIEVFDGYGTDPPAMKVTYYAAEKFRFFSQKAKPYGESDLYATKEELLRTI